MKELIERKLNVLSHKEAATWKDIKKLSDKENYIQLKEQLETLGRIKWQIYVLKDTLVGI